MPAIGVIYTAGMSAGDFGMAVSNGLFKKINTIAYSAGQILYPNTSGGFQTTPSTAPNAYNQPLAYVVRSHAVNGEIMINVGQKEKQDQTITLTGDVTGSGTGSFAATLANTAVTA